MAFDLPLFTDFGTLGRVDNVIRACTGAQYSGIGTCVKDNLAFRGSAGISVELEIALRPGSDRSGPALSSKPAMTGPRSSTSPLEQDSKTMKKTLLALAFAGCLALPALAANPAPPPIRPSPRSW